MRTYTAIGTFTIYRLFHETSLIEVCHDASYQETPTNVAHNPRKSISNSCQATIVIMWLHLALFSPFNLEIIIAVEWHLSECTNTNWSQPFWLCGSIASVCLCHCNRVQSQGTPISYQYMTMNVVGDLASKRNITSLKDLPQETILELMVRKRLNYWIRWKRQSLPTTPKTQIIWQNRSL